MNEDAYTNVLTDEEIEAVEKVLCDTIETLLRCADEHNLDRDDFIQDFAESLLDICRVDTFESYGRDVVKA